MRKGYRIRKDVRWEGGLLAMLEMFHILPLLYLPWL